MIYFSVENFKNYGFRKLSASPDNFRRFYVEVNLKLKANILPLSLFSWKMRSCQENWTNLLKTAVIQPRKKEEIC